MFRDVAVSTLSDEPWLDHHLVRITFRGIRARDPFQSVKALDGLALEYQVIIKHNVACPDGVSRHSAVFVIIGPIPPQLSS